MPEGVMETAVVQALLVSLLSGDATLQAACGSRIYQDFAPEVDPATGQPPLFPILVFSLQSSRDTLGNSAQRIQSRPVFLVKVIGERSGTAALFPLVNRIDALLNRTDYATVRIAGVDYSVGGSYRQRGISYKEVSRSGIDYYHCGGLYEFFV
jgi:hypothetical protein